MPKDWTPEQTQLAMRYGICLRCGAPLKPRHAVRVEDGKTVYSHSLVCLNGHKRG